MLNPKKIFLLWLFLAVVAFLSCGDITDPDIHTINNMIKDFSFMKVDIDSHSNMPVRNLTDDCLASDIFGLFCHIMDSPTLLDSATVKITTSKGDVEFAQLSMDPFLAYLAVARPQWRRYTSYIPNDDMYPNAPYFFLPNLRVRITSEINQRDGVLSIFPDGDILTATIKGKNQTLQATLNISSK